MWRLNGFWSWTDAGGPPPSSSSGLWWGDSISIEEGIEIDGGLEIPEGLVILSIALLAVGVTFL